MSREEIIAMAREAGIVERDGCGLFVCASEMSEVFEFAALVAAKEREACAQACESRVTPGTGSVAILGGAADAIRARGNHVA